MKGWARGGPGVGPGWYPLEAGLQRAVPDGTRQTSGEALTIGGGCTNTTRIDGRAPPLGPPPHHLLSTSFEHLLPSCLFIYFFLSVCLVSPPPPSSLFPPPSSLLHPWLLHLRPNLFSWFLRLVSIHLQLIRFTMDRVFSLSSGAVSTPLPLFTMEHPPKKFDPIAGGRRIVFFNIIQGNLQGSIEMLMIN